MTTITWLLTLLLASFGAVTPNAAPPASADMTTEINISAESGIKFTDTSWREVLKQAKAQKKIIFLDAYASWCGPCKMLQKNVFTQKTVGDYYNGRFINVKMDMEKGEGPALMQVYPLEAYPTLMFIDGNGRVLKKVLGYQTPENLIAIGQSVK